MLQYSREMTIIVGAGIWIFVALRRIRQGRDLGRPLRRTVWLPLILAMLVGVQRVWKTRALLNVLQVSGAINARQRQLFVDDMVHEVVTVVTLGIVLTGILGAIAWFETQNRRINL